MTSCPRRSPPMSPALAPTSPGRWDTLENCPPVVSHLETMSGARPPGGVGTRPGGWGWRGRGDLESFC